MRRRVAVYGAGGLGREVARAALAAPDLELFGFLDDGLTPGTPLHGVTVLGGFSAVAELPDDVGLFVAIGTIDVHRQLVARIEALPRDPGFPNVIHPNATVDLDTVVLGRGNYIAAGAVLTADVAMGDFNLVNINTSLAHDVVLGDRCQVNPGAVVNGQVVLGSEVVVGAGAILLPRVTVEDGAIIGPGAVLTRKRVRAGMTMLGNPATPFRRAG